MQTILTVYLAEFVRGLWSNVKDRIVDALFLIAGLAFWAARGGLQARTKESVLPWVWTICVIICYHAWRAAQETARREGQKNHTIKLPILSPSGVAIERTVPTVAHLRIK